MTASALASPDPAAAPRGPHGAQQPLGGRYLTFRLDDEQYGIDITAVQEIVSMMHVTPVPRAAKFLHGVINLRGKIIPIIDLRVRFGMTPVMATATTCIVVVRTGGPPVGIVVDNVCEVLDIAPADADALPALGPYVNSEFVSGIGRSGDTVTLLLDVDEIVAMQPADSAPGSDLSTPSLRISSTTNDGASGLPGPTSPEATGGRVRD